MNTYEVSFPLESGYVLNIIIASPGPEAAKAGAHKMLRTAAEPKGEGDVIRFCWRLDDVTVKPINVRP